MHKEYETTTDTLEVKATPLDSVSDQLGMAHFIFIDTEGEKIKILQGANSYIKNYFPAIVLEADPTLLCPTGFSIRELYDKVKSFGYSPYKISQFGIHKITHPDVDYSADWLYINPKKKKLINKIQRFIFFSGLLPCIPKINPMLRLKNSGFFLHFMTLYY